MVSSGSKDYGGMDRSESERKHWTYCKTPRIGKIGNIS